MPSLEYCLSFRILSVILTEMSLLISKMEKCAKRAHVNLMNHTGDLIMIDQWNIN